MNKQEYMAMSLPYWLKAELNKNSIEVINASRWGNINGWDSDDYTPILRPLSDLTKPIEHKGGTFVPIVELAKIATAKIKPSDCSLFEVNKEHFKHGCRLWDNFFWYDEKGFFGWIIATSKKEHKLFVENQLELFQKLIEWHFNLMDESEPFIDANSLETNPYK